MPLQGHDFGTGCRVTPIPAHPLRVDGLARIDEPPPGGRIGQRRFEGLVRRLRPGFFRVFGRVKISVLLGFTIAAYNLDRIRSFRANAGRTRQRAETTAEEKAGHLGRGRGAVREGGYQAAVDGATGLSTPLEARDRP